MNRLKNEQTLIDVLQNYHIRPVEIVQKGRMFIVHTKSQSFTVQIMKENDAQLALWESVFHEANRHQIHTILPVYKTINDVLYVQKGNEYYYVTPYVEKEGTVMMEDLFQTIGDIHQSTKRTIVVPKEKVIEQFKAYLHIIEEKHLYLQQIIDLFEQQHYMSPFELQVCTHFHIVDQAFRQSATHISSLLTRFEEDAHDHIEWAYSLCHNALRIDHFTRSSDIYITNWEHATYANATTDIIQFCQREFRNNRYPIDAFIKGFITYEKAYKLDETEQHLLSMYLLHPIPYVEAVQSYVAQPRKDAVISHVIALERIFRSVSNGYFMLHEVDRLNRESPAEDTIK